MGDRILHNGMFYSPHGEFRCGTLHIKDQKIDGFDPCAGTPPAGATDAGWIDLHGGFVIPGFVDGHVHLMSLVFKRLRCDLSATNSAREVCDALAEWAAENDSPFVIGVDFDESGWENRKFPTRAMLDGVDDKRPVLARRICGHIGAANTPMLELLKTRPDLLNRETGVVTEHAVWEAGRICEPDASTIIASTAAAIDDLYALGITCIHDIVEEKKFDTYLEGIRQAQTPLRIDALINTNPRHLRQFVTLCAAADVGNVRVVGAKCFLDGSIGGHTAALNADYADKPGWGTLLMQRPVLQAVAEECFDNGYQLAIHAIGDRSLDLATGVLRGFPADAENFRIEHCEIAAPAQIDGLNFAPAALSLQPNFIRNWGGPGGLNETRLGTDRNRWCNAYRTLHETGKPCFFGSDGMPVGPLYGLKGAIEHPVPEERMAPEEALACYTRTAHTVGAHSREAGTLETGGLADFVVLSGNPLTEDLDAIDVRTTVVGGEVVYDSGRGASAAGNLQEGESSV